MNVRILKKDLRRKKSINLILLVFVFLSVTFIAGSLNNFSVIQNGVEEFMEESELGDFSVITMGGSYESISENDREIQEFLENQEQVGKVIVDDQVFLTKNQTQIGTGEHMELDSTVLLCSISMKGQKFFQEENQEITHMKKGTIYLNRTHMQKNNLEIGDSLTICTENGYRKTFSIAGSFKDAFLGSDMMGTKRMLVSQEDYEELRAESGLPYGRTYTVYCDDLEKFETAYNNQDFSVLFGADQALIKMTYVMEMVMAAVILGVSICLIAIALVMLKFTIVFTVNEDYKEIGIMKAIGIKDGAIRRLYVAKYFVLAAAGALLGFLVSIPFSQLLVDQVTEQMVLKKDGTGVLLQLAVSLLVLSLVTVSGYHNTRKIGKMTPMDAIRRGNNGERFRRKGLFHLQGSRRKATTFLACNDVASELRKYLVLVVTGMLGVWLVVMPVNTINTLRSDGLLKWFGTQQCDFFIEDDEKIAELILAGEKQGYYDYMEETKQLLKEHGIEAKDVFSEIFFHFKIRKGEKSYQSFSCQGINTVMGDYFYDEGMTPMYENEIAITHVVAEKIDADIGDTVYITIQGREQPYLVTALYQSMNNMGQGIRFTQDAKLDYTAVSGSFGLQVRLAEQDAEITQVTEQVQKIMPKVKVETVSEFVDRTVGGISDQLNSLKLLILMVMMIINILVVVLMQKMFLIREQGEMGMLKAVGFSNQALIGWQTKRIMLVLFFGIAAGTLTGEFFSRITSGKVFQMMGATEIAFVVNPLEVYIIYPLLLFAATVAACVITMRKVRKISVQEINEID